MSNYVTDKVVEGNLLEHPAVLAWSALQSRSGTPQAVTVLKEHKKRPWKRKSAVYRLEGIGPSGSAIVAKRCELSTAALERVIYEKILPSARVPALAYYGSVDEVDGGFCWLFLEDARGTEYSYKIDEHRAAAARWLAMMHGATHKLQQAVSLPDRGPMHYLEHLESGYSGLVNLVGNPVLRASDIEILRALIGDLELLRSCWSQIECICSDIPSALAHGDFVAKNIRVRTSSIGHTVVPFDWETSGWGLPAADLGAGARPELEAYWSAVREVWPHLDFKVIQRMALIGNVFRLTAAIDWGCVDFSPAWPEQIMWSMVKYRDRLQNLLTVSPWSN